MTLHNLATVNYIEILEFQEKGAPTNLMQQLDEVESTKREEDLKNRKLNEEIEIQKREKLYQERLKILKDKVNQQVKINQAKQAGSKDNKLYSAKLKKERFLDKMALKISK